MPILIERPTIIAAAGSKQKRIEEYVGRASSGEEKLSVARMVSPGGWHARQRLDSTDLCSLQPHEVATPRKRVAQARDLRTWNMDDRTVDPPPQTLTELQSVTPIALLVGSVCLEPHLVRIDHDKLSPCPRRSSSA
jgi:hypothetical protein